MLNLHTLNDKVLGMFGLLSRRIIALENQLKAHKAIIDRLTRQIDLSETKPEPPPFYLH